MNIRDEADGLRRSRSQFVTLKPGRGQHCKYLPLAFKDMRRRDPELAKGWGANCHPPFPEHSFVQLTREERDALTSQIAISKPGRGGRRTLPYAFAEHGAMTPHASRLPHRASPRHSDFGLRI
jgi:hypothetical protein